MCVEKGDKVWWRVKAGMCFRTVSGTVEEINNGMATVCVQTQNVHGKQVNRNVNHLNKKK